MSDTPELKVRHSTVLDDETRHVSRVYAEALYRAAEQKNAVETAGAELLSLVQDVYKANPGLESFFSAAGVSPEKKKAAIDKAFTGNASETFVHFLDVLNKHGRLDMLRGIADAFKTLYERKTKKVEVRVTSAVPLTDDEKARLLADVRSVSGLEPVLKEILDPEILGGLVVRVADWVYDASVRTRITAIKNQLIDRSSHAIQGGRDRFGSRA